MADILFPLALCYTAFIFYAQKRYLFKYSLILQFILGWTILELAWLHGIISVTSLIMAIGDLDDWSFSTLIGFPLTAYNAFLLWEIHHESNASEDDVKLALDNGLGENYQADILDERKKQLEAHPHKHAWLKPFSFKTDHMKADENIIYGPNDRNTLSVFCDKRSSKTLRPVMLQIHGGGWTLGHSEYQGLPLRNKLVEAGWVFVSINYRLSPKHKFPDHIIDCKKALTWIKENIEEYGGDPKFIMATGGSAGGHLCSLLALTENKFQDQLQPGFEDQDTSIQGAIPMYGVYDFADRNDLRFGMPLTGFLEDYVMPHKFTLGDELWEIASPIAQVHSDRPPFMVMHGELDTLAFVEDARAFVAALKESSDKTCIYAELPNTQHAFDIFHSPRCDHSIQAMHTFAEYTYSQYLQGDYISAADK